MVCVHWRLCIDGLSISWQCFLLDTKSLLREVSAWLLSPSMKTLLSQQNQQVSNTSSAHRPNYKWPVCSFLQSWSLHDHCDALLCFELFGFLSVYFQAPPTTAVFCMCLRQMVVQEVHWSCWGVWQCCELLMKKVETLWSDLKLPPIIDCWLLITFR